MENFLMALKALNELETNGIIYGIILWCEKGFISYFN